MKAQTRNALTVAASLGGLALVVAGIGALTQAPPGLERPSRSPSTFFSDPPGARALFLVAQRLLPSAEPWRRPFTQLPPSGTLIVAGPAEDLSAAEADALDAWLSAGGRLILAADGDWGVQGRAKGFLAGHGIAVEGTVDAEPALRTARATCLPDEPLSLRLRKGCRVRGPGEAVARDGADVLALAAGVGRGKAIVVPDASFVSNASLRGSDNAVLLIALASGQAVLFDEYHHGFGERRSELDLAASLMTTPWGWAIASALAAGALYVFGCRRRFGRILEPPTVSRQDPMATVDARAGLFRAAGARAMAIDLFCGDLEHELGVAAGRPVDLAELLRERRAAPAGTLARDVERLIALRESKGAGEAEVFRAARLAGRILKETARG